MRTTLTLDDDVAVVLSRLREERGLGLKQLVNEALRAGLPSLERAPDPTPRYETPTSDPGPPALPGVHSIHELLAFAEGEAYR